MTECCRGSVRKRAEATKIKATGKVIEGTFALVLTIQGNEIVRFQMLEDSYATAVAAQP